MGHTYKCREAELVPVPRYCLRMVEKIGTCHAGEVSICNISTVHTHCVPCLIQCGRWDFLQDMGGVNWIQYSHHYFILFFSYLYTKYKACACPVNQLPIVWPHPFTHTKILYARNQQPLHSRAINLCSGWPHCEQPCLYSSLAWMWVSNPLWSVQKFLSFIGILSWFKVCLC